MLNAIGKSGKSASELHIYLLFNEFRSELASISQLFHVMEVNWLLRALSSS